MFQFLVFYVLTLEYCLAVSERELIAPLEEETIPSDTAPSNNENDFLTQVKKINSLLNHNRTVFNPHPIKPAACMVIGEDDDFFPWRKTIPPKQPPKVVEPPPSRPPPKLDEPTLKDNEEWRSEDLNFGTPTALWNWLKANKSFKVGCEDFLQSLDTFKWKGNSTMFGTPFGLWKWLKTNKWFTTSCEDFVKSLN